MTFIQGEETIPIINGINLGTYRITMHLLLRPPIILSVQRRRNCQILIIAHYLRRLVVQQVSCIYFFVVVVAKLVAHFLVQDGGLVHLIKLLLERDCCRVGRLREELVYFVLEGHDGLFGGRIV
jgi:hypothetical protein